jgi:hypothetical protein
MKKNLLLFLFLIPVLLHAQNLPSCDSLTIHCCTFDSVGPNTLTLFADNQSMTEFYGYPNFVLFDANMDTIAKETVTYFGIGPGFQAHTLDIRTPVVLPFSGKLNLYKDFYATLCCSFPFYIPDTVNSTGDMDAKNSFEIFPNPASDKVTVSLKNNSELKGFDISVVDLAGRPAITLNAEGYQFQFSTLDLQQGIYFLKFADKKSGYIFIEKLIVNN